MRPARAFEDARRRRRGRGDGHTYRYARLLPSRGNLGVKIHRATVSRMLAQAPIGACDRLARSTFNLFAIVKQIVDAKAQFRSLAEPWADTGTSTGRLMIAVLGGLTDVERDLIRTRTAEGRSRAKARGQHMGRPPSSHRHSRKRPPGGARRARRCRN